MFNLTLQLPCWESVMDRQKDGQTLACDTFSLNLQKTLTNVAKELSVAE